MALFHRPALPRQRHTLHRPDALAVLIQLRHGRLRHLPGFWPGDRRGLRPGDSQRQAYPACRRHQGHADAGLERGAGRFDAPRRGGRHSARHALVQTHARAAGLGHQRLTELERQMEPALVRHQALFRIPRKQGLQDAYSCAAVQVSQLHAMRDLWRRPFAAGVAALAAWHQGGRRCRAADRGAFYARGCEVEPRAAGGLARPVPA